LIALQGVGLAVLVPLLPFSLELIALRRMRVAAFGTLMALEPGIGTLIGVLVLSQLPTPWQIAGVALVVVAGIGAQRGPAPPSPGGDSATDRRAQPVVCAVDHA
jgi:inner membrane transporter RhtA